MPAIVTTAYDCPTQTLTITIAGAGAYRVAGVVVPGAQPLPAGDFPPPNAPFKDGNGPGNIQLQDNAWPMNGSVKWRAWLLIPGGTHDGNKDCGPNGGGSSSSSASQSSSSSSA